MTLLSPDAAPPAQGGRAEGPVARVLVGRLFAEGPMLCLAGSVVAQMIPWLALGLPQTALSDLLVGLAFFWGLWRAIRARRTWILTAWPFLAALMGLVLAVVSALSSPEPKLAVMGLVRIVEIFVFFPGACLLVIRRRSDVRLMVGSLMFLYGGQCLVGIWQFTTGHGALIAGKPVRGVGTFGPTNISVLASMASSGLGVALAAVLAYRGRARLAAVVLAAIMAGGLVAGLGRSSWITAFAICIVLCTRFDLKRAVAVVAGGALAAWITITIAASSSSPIAQRIMSVVDSGDEPDQSGIDRLSLWQAARAIINDHPFWGVGPRQFQAHRDAYSPLALLGSSDIGTAGSFERQALLSPHNLYYLLSTEFGVPAAACFFFVAAAALVVGAYRLRRTPRSNSLAWLVGLASTSVLISFFVGGMFGDLGGPASTDLGWSLGLAAWWASHRGLLPDDGEVIPPGEEGGIWWARPAPPPSRGSTRFARWRHEPEWTALHRAGTTSEGAST